MPEGMGLLAEMVLFNPTEGVKILVENILSDQKIEDPMEVLIKQSEIREGY